MRRHLIDILCGIIFLAVLNRELLPVMITTSQAGTIFLVTFFVWVIFWIPEMRRNWREFLKNRRPGSEKSMNFTIVGISMSYKTFISLFVIVLVISFAVIIWGFIEFFKEGIV